MDDVTLRPAHRNDAADLAILDNIAGHGISSWFWQGAVIHGKAEDAYDWGRKRLADDDAPYGWKNATIAESEGMTLGSICHYIMPVSDPEDPKRQPEPFRPVMDLFAEAVSDWFVDSFAVYKHARRKGVGRKLFDHSLRKGKANAARRISLVVEDGNEAAIAFYKSYQMKVRSKRPYLSFGFSSKSRNWLLLSAALT